MAHPCYVCNFYPVPDGEAVECPHCHRLQYGNTCPHCGQNSPTIIKGLKVMCGACGQERGPIGGGMPMNLAGKPTQVGGFVTRALGWMGMGGTAIAGVIAALLFHFGWTIFGSLFAFVAAISFVFSAVLLRSGKRLSQRGERAGQNAREQAVYALAGNRNGIVTATDVAAALNIQHAEADAMLTAMARQGTNVGVEVDGSGVVHYVFKNFRPAGEQHPVGQVRVEPEGVRADGGAPAIQDPEAQARANVDREFERMRTLQDLQKR